jgi:hypothetical protein
VPPARYTMVAAQEEELDGDLRSEGGWAKPSS